MTGGNPRAGGRPEPTSGPLGHSVSGHRDQRAVAALERQAAAMERLATELELIGPVYVASVENLGRVVESLMEAFRTTLEHMAVLGEALTQDRLTPPEDGG